MKKIGGLDPLAFFMLILVILCAGALVYEGFTRLQRPARQPAAPASAPAPAPAEQPKPEAPAEQPSHSSFRGNG